MFAENLLQANFLSSLPYAYNLSFDRNAYDSRFIILTWCFYSIRIAGAQPVE
jgi:hypothetical protein